MYTKEQVARLIDHAVLKPDMTDTVLGEHAKICMENKVYSMCVKPFQIKTAKKLLRGSGIKVSCVLSFPHGSDSSPVKEFQARQAIEDGTDEIDMVMNIGKFLDEDYNYVVEDIKAVTGISHDRGVIVKVILETGFLSLGMIKKACELAYRGEADFVKTCTGFGPGKATPQVVELMIKAARGKMKVKASGGIRTWKDAVTFIEVGAGRLGTGSTLEVLSGAKQQECC